MLGTVQKFEIKVELPHVGTRLLAKTQLILCSRWTSFYLQSVEHLTFNQTSRALISLHVLVSASCRTEILGEKSLSTW